MKTDNLQNYLNSFGKQVVNRAKGGLQRKKGGGTELEKSIKFKVVKDAKGYTVQFFMNSYGTFVDKGVSGTNKTRKFKDYKKKVVSSPYKYTNKQPPRGIIDKWIVKKGIAPRDEQGRFTSRKSLSFLIARSIKRQGIQGISFFQKPLGLGLEQFGSQILSAIKTDITKAIKQ